MKKRYIFCDDGETRGEVISRGLPGKNIWGDSILNSWSMAIDAHMQYLRKKIAANPSEQDYIVTVGRL